MCCCLDLILILMGSSRRVSHFLLGIQWSCNIPTCLPVCHDKHVFLFVIMLITQISAPKRFSLTSRPFKRVCHSSKSGDDYRRRRRREFNWMSQLVLSPCFAKGQVFFLFWFFFQNEPSLSKGCEVVPPTQIQLTEVTLNSTTSLIHLSSTCQKASSAHPLFFFSKISELLCKYCIWQFLASSSAAKDISADAQMTQG